MRRPKPTQPELTEQAASQQKRVASGLRSLSKELSAMARGSEQPGMATDLAQQAGERANAVASWLEEREPGHVVDEITRFGCGPDSSPATRAGRSPPPGSSPRT